MMDMDRIDSNQISGLDSQEMNFLDHLLADTDDIIFNQWTGLPVNTDLNANYELTEDQLNEIHHLEAEAKSKNTERQTKAYIKMLKTFLTITSNEAFLYLGLHGLPNSEI